jgi:NRPS condensation-like uncharacterized protein
MSEANVCAAKLSASVTPKVLRPLGHLEQWMWRANQHRSGHFVFAAQVEGQTTIEGWRAALDVVQRRHPLLSVCIETDENSVPYFRQVIGAPVPLRVVSGDDSVLDWEHEVERELSLPVNAQQAPLVRAVLLHQNLRAVYILSAHHSIADGLSVAFVIRDTLQALNGKSMAPLPLLPAQEELLNISENTAGEATSSRESNSSEPPQPVTNRNRDNPVPRVKGLHLPFALTAALRKCARKERTTVHGALCAALALARQKIAGESSTEPVRILSPINTRKLLGLGEECALLISFGRVSIELTSNSTFWDLARLAKLGLANAQTLEGIVRALGALRQVRPRLNASATPNSGAQASYFEMMVSNLGNLPFETNFGDLKLERLWTAFVAGSGQSEQTIIATTVNGALCLMHTSYTPTESLLEVAEQILISACAGAGSPEKDHGMR